MGGPVPPSWAADRNRPLLGGAGGPGVSAVGRQDGNSRPGTAIVRIGAGLEEPVRVPVHYPRPGGAHRMSLKKPKVVVVLPAYNAAKTLHMTYADLPRDMVDLVILVDDGSSDETAKIARELGLELFVHDRNYGYGANQKTCYREALRAGAT